MLTACHRSIEIDSQPIIIIIRMVTVVLASCHSNNNMSACNVYWEIMQGDLVRSLVVV